MRILPNLVFASVIALVACNTQHRTRTESVPATTSRTDSTTRSIPQPKIVAPAHEAQAWFAFADSTGSRLIHPGPDTLPEGPYFVAALDGIPTPLDDAGSQKESADWDFRAVANRFGSIGGHVFKSPKRIFAPDRTYLVVTRQFLETHHPVPAVSGNCQEIGGDIPSLSIFSKKRRIRTAWNLASLPDGYIASMVYEGAPPLAALALVRGDSSLQESFEGLVSEDSSSVWRVDDGGVFDGCNLEILAAFTAPTGLEIAYSWGAFEGEVEVLLRRSADTFEVALHGSRYWSP